VQVRQQGEPSIEKHSLYVSRLIVRQPGGRWLQDSLAQQGMGSGQRHGLMAMVACNRLNWCKKVGLVSWRGRPPNASYHVPRKNDNPSRPGLNHHISRHRKEAWRPRQDGPSRLSCPKCCCPSGRVLGLPDPCHLAHSAYGILGEVLCIASASFLAGLGFVAPWPRLPGSYL
jgi:hypothetical protein